MPTSVDPNKLRELILLGLNSHEIANQLSVSTNTVYRACRENSLSIHAKRARPNTYISHLGKRHNHITIDGFFLKGRYYWANARCDCGFAFTSKPRAIVKGERKTCGKRGCPHFHSIRSQNGKRSNFTGYGEIYGSRWASIRIGAESRGMEFDITIEQAWNMFLLQGRRCSLTGVLLTFGNTYNRLFNASLDRIDSSKGYSIDNVRWVHKAINVMKMAMSDETFMFWINAIYNHSIGNAPPSEDEVSIQERPILSAKTWKKPNGPRKSRKRSATDPNPVP